MNGNAGTIQLDFALPGQSKCILAWQRTNDPSITPVMTSPCDFRFRLERFIGIITEEEYAGSFPAWLAPVRDCDEHYR